VEQQTRKCCAGARSAAIRLWGRRAASKGSCAGYCSFSSVAICTRSASVLACIFSISLRLTLLTAAAALIPMGLLLLFRYPVAELCEKLLGHLIGG
jgi:hypothetical protein